MVEHNCFLCALELQKSERPPWRMLQSGAFRLRRLSSYCLWNSVTSGLLILPMFWGLWKKSGNWGDASESRSASWPLPPTRRTETGVTSPACGVGWRASCPEPACTSGSWSLRVWVFGWLHACLIPSVVGQGKLPLGLTSENAKKTKDSLLSLFSSLFLAPLFVVLRMEKLLPLHSLPKNHNHFLFCLSFTDQFCSLSTVCTFGCVLVSYLLGSQSCQLCCSPCICHPLWNILCCLLLWVVSI